MNFEDYAFYPALILVFALCFCYIFWWLRRCVIAYQRNKYESRLRRHRRDRRRRRREERRGTISVEAQNEDDDDETTNSEARTSDDGFTISATLDPSSLPSSSSPSSSSPSSSTPSSSLPDLGESRFDRILRLIFCAPSPATAARLREENAARSRRRRRRNEIDDIEETPSVPAVPRLPPSYEDTLRADGIFSIDAPGSGSYTNRGFESSPISPFSINSLPPYPDLPPPYAATSSAASNTPPNASSSAAPEMVDAASGSNTGPSTSSPGLNRRRSSPPDLRPLAENSSTTTGRKRPTDGSKTESRAKNDADDDKES